MTIKEFELQHAFCILVKVLSSWPVDDYEQARIIAYSVHSEQAEQDYMQRVFEEADKRRPLLIEEVVNSERTPNEFVNEPRGNGEKNKISSLEAVRKRRERNKNELREYTPCGLPVRQSTAKQYRLTEGDKEYIKSFAVDGVVPLDAYLCALEHLPDQY